MKRLASLLIVALLGSLALLPSGGASAATVSGGGATVSTRDVTTGSGGCGTATTSVGGTMDGAPYWDVTVTVYDPQGRWVSAAQIDESSAVRSLASRVCTAGRYRVVADYTTYDSQIRATSVRQLASTFTVTAGSNARALVASSRVVKKAWNVTGTLHRAGRAWTGQRVTLQVRKHGVWKTVARRTTDVAGQVSFRLAPGAKRKVRLVSADATSLSLRLPRR